MVLCSHRCRRPERDGTASTMAQLWYGRQFREPCLDALDALNILRIVHDQPISRYVYVLHTCTASHAADPRMDPHHLAL